MKGKGMSKIPSGDPAAASERRGRPEDISLSKSKRNRGSSLEKTDEHGDAIFRFRLEFGEKTKCESLEVYYRDTIRDLLKVVRFYFGDKPVLVDAFAFVSRPDQQIRILEVETN